MQDQAGLRTWNNKWIFSKHPAINCVKVNQHLTFFENFKAPKSKQTESSKVNFLFVCFAVIMLAIRKYIPSPQYRQTSKVNNSKHWHTYRQTKRTCGQIYIDRDKHKDRHTNSYDTNKRKQTQNDTQITFHIQTTTKVNSNQIQHFI